MATRTVDIARYMLSNVKDRRFSHQDWHDDYPPVVVAKMDIESSEYTVLPHLLRCAPQQ